MEEAPRPLEFPSSGEISNSEEVDDAEAVGKEDGSGSGGVGGEVAVVDVSGKSWEMPLFGRASPPPDAEVEGLYVYHNEFSLLPRSIGRFGRLKTLKFFANEVDVLPPEAGELVELERLQVKVSWPGLSGIPFRKMRTLKELELCKVPSRPSALSILAEIAGLSCLRKLSLCHFSIRYLPPEIGCLKKLEELDLSFNKLKSLPSNISELSALKLLRVSNNKLEDLPSGLSSLRRLESLDLSNNRLASLASLDLSSMCALQFLNLQYNKLLNCWQIPSWICCNFEGNGKDTCNDEIKLVDMDIVDTVVPRIDGRRSSSGCQCSSSTLLSDVTYFSRSNAKRMRKKWKRRNYLQQRARQERLNYSRKCRGQDQNEYQAVKMAENGKLYKRSLLGKKDSESQLHTNEEKHSHCSPRSCSLSENPPDSIDDLNGDGLDLAGDSISLVYPIYTDNEKSGLDGSKSNCGDDCSCITSELAGFDGGYGCESQVDEDGPSIQHLTEPNVQDEDSSSEESKIALKSKRHFDKDLDNPKPSKCRRPVDECLYLACKYNTESFCSIDDHLPDGFYDAGRERRFMPLHDYEQKLCLDSREVILLDRKRDEELDAIALSAQILLSTLKRSCSSAEKEGYAVDDLHRASMLALFVSDCFGGSDRSSTILRIRKAVVGSKKRQPFVCTCSTGNSYNNEETSKQKYGIAGSFNFADLCEKSLQFTKETRNSNVIPIGTVQFGVCRHRAVLMKYLCDRADPPLPCELVRGYLDFMPHAWNAILIRRGSSCVRMVVDACYPTDIREETDLEYFCRYIPLCRVHVPLTTEDSTLFKCSFPSLSLCPGSEDVPTSSVKQCKFGSLVAAAKVRNLDTFGASEEDIKIFEYTFLGEVRMLGALRKHKCIVEIYGHQLSSKWVTPADGDKEHRLLQSTIVMEYVKGGSLKNYLDKLSKEGKKHAPITMALYIAWDIACALVEVHSKHIIHRDIKSENILIDLDGKRIDGTPVVKLSDFDRAVPRHSFLHSCCIAHLGIYPPDVCVGTPRWMAPEVLRTMHKRTLYGLEVDIWSYGCLLLELLTLQIPYEGLPESEIFDLLQMQQRPRLTPDLEELALSNEPTMTCLKLGLTSSEGEAEMLKLLIDLFYRCTRENPADRPTAKDIYDMLCDARLLPDSNS